MGMYRDTSKGHVDQVVLVSNDSDAEPVLEAIVEDFPQIWDHLWFEIMLHSRSPLAERRYLVSRGDLQSIPLQEQAAHRQFEGYVCGDLSGFRLQTKPACRAGSL